MLSATLKSVQAAIPNTSRASLSVFKIPTPPLSVTVTPVPFEFPNSNEDPDGARIEEVVMPLVAVSESMLTALKLVSASRFRAIASERSKPLT